MPNVGYTGGELGGTSEASNARTTGRLSGTDGFDGFVKGSRIAFPGDANDDLGDPGDVFGSPGQLSDSTNR